MAQYIDTDAVSTGTGTELSPYNASQAASVNLNSADIIYVKGSADLVFQSSGSFTIINCLITYWPGTTKRETKIIFSAEGTAYWRPLTYGFQAIGVHISFRNNSSLPYSQRPAGGIVSFKDCKISVSTGTGTNAIFFSTSDLTEISHSEIDMTNFEDWIQSANAFINVSFINNKIHSFSSLTDPAFKLTGPSVFRNNKVYNMDTAQGIIYPNLQDEFPQVEHNTFWITDTSTPVINATELDTAPRLMNFLSNVVAYQTSQPFITNLLSALEGGLRGNNLFYNCSLGLYAPLSGYSDYTDGTNPFKSTTDTDSDFLELVATSNGKFADAIFPNTDIGAVQGVGNVLFPEVYEVKAGVSFGNGVSGDRTGTRIEPTEADVRDGTTYGDPDNLRTGTLEAFALDDVIVAAGGNYVENVEADVKAGVEYGAPSAVKTGQATLLEPLPTHTEVLVYTSDGSNISGSHALPTKVFDVAVGTNVDTWLASLGVAETVAGSTAVIERNTQNQNFIQIKLVR